MIHLNIQQGQNIEVVSANLIKKLYEAALSVPEPLEGEQDAAYMSGNLQVDRSYRSYVQYLTDRFHDLHINVTDSYYIPVEDSAVLNVLLANNIGDGVGITEAEAANATFTSSTFQGNTDITSFNGFKYFTKANTNPPNQLFSDCTNLTSIDLSNVTALSQSEFKNTALTSVDFTGSTIISIPKDCFRSCTSLTSVVLPNTCTVLREGCFAYTASLTTIDTSNIKTLDGNNIFRNSNINYLNFPAIESISDRSLINVTNCTTVDLGPNLASIGVQAFWSSSFTTFIFRGTTVPTFNMTNSDKFVYNMNNVSIYVPESALSDYQTAWPAMASNIVKIEGSIYDTQS